MTEIEYLEEGIKITTKYREVYLALVLIVLVSSIPMILSIFGIFIKVGLVASIAYLFGMILYFLINTIELDERDELLNKYTKEI